MRAYSQDLRQRIIRAVDEGMPKSAVARTFRVARSTVNAYIALRRNSGGLAPKPIPGRPAHLSSADHPALLDQLRAHHDATLKEHCALWQDSHGVRLSLTAMHRAIARSGWTRKERQSGRPSKTPWPEGNGARKSRRSRAKTSSS